MYKSYRTLILAGIVTVFSFSAVVPAFASTSGRKNTALVVTAATVYSALKKNNTATIAGALVSAQAWKNYEDSRKRDSRKKSQRYGYYNSRNQRSTYYGAKRSYSKHGSYKVARRR